MWPCQLLVRMSIMLFQLDNVADNMAVCCSIRSMQLKRGAVVAMWGPEQLPFSLCVW